MAEIQDVEEAPRAKTTRTAGAAQPGGAGGAKALGPELLSKEAVAALGEAIGGRTHWQSDLARRCGVSKSQVTRYINGERPTNTILAHDLKGLVLDKIETLGELLSTPGLPEADAPEVAQAQEMIRDAIALLRGEIALEPRKP